MDEKSIFNAARKIADQTAREEYLKHACGDDQAGRIRILELLAEHDQVSSFLESPPIEMDMTRSVSASSEPIGSQIGPYKLLQEIGQGGMGTVYMAEQEQPVQRRVALKIIKPGMDTRQVVARFDAERQALSMMDHPGIAQVLDVGTTDSNRPFFVMELIKGLPITQYCDEKKLPLKQRLELFKSVCKAVQHAHQKGIIHRDIKPSNILVAEYDDQAVPKIIDFGLAKALHQRLTEMTMFTRLGQIVGTLEYMSPEQSTMNQMDVDTRTDIYSLGVLLYELLTGTTPFDKQRLHSAALDQVLKIIREEEPPKPSTRLSTAETEPQFAASHGIEAKKLSLLMRGDLDWIVMKALEKERGRRYETANGLAMDVDRYLLGEPVVAAPPSTAYRMRKFVTRNRAAVMAGGLVALTLLLGVIGTTGGMFWALAEKDKATRAALAETQQRTIADANAERAIKETQRAEREAQRAIAAEANAKQRASELRQVADFQAQQLASVDPEVMGLFIRRALIDAAPEDRQENLTQAVSGLNFTNLALQTLEKNIFQGTIQAIDTQFKDQPLVQAKLLATMGTTLKELGLLNLARDPLERALAIAQDEVGEQDPNTLIIKNEMGSLLLCLGKMDDAYELFSDSLKGLREALGDLDPTTLSTMNDMGVSLLRQGRFTDAEKYLRMSLEARRRVLGNGDQNTIHTINNLGDLLLQRGELSEAEPLLQETLQWGLKQYGENHPATMNFINNIAVLRDKQGRHAEAEPYFRKALEFRRRFLGDDHPLTITSVNNLGFVLHNQGKLDEAEPYYREALQRGRRIFDDDHPKLLNAINNMGAWYEGMEMPVEAETYFREALEGHRRVLDENHPKTLATMINVGNALYRQGKLADAEPFIKEGLAGKIRILGPENLGTLGTLNLYAQLLQSQAKLEEAEKHFRRGIEAARRKYGDHSVTALLEHHLANVLVRLERPDEALPYARAAVERYRAHPDWSPRESNHAESVLTETLLAAGRIREAMSELHRRTDSVGRGEAAWRASRLAVVADRALSNGKPSDLEFAQSAARECLQIRKEILHDDHPQVWLRHNAASLLGGALLAKSAITDDPQTAGSLLREAQPMLVDSAQWMLSDPRMPTPEQLGGHDRAGEATQRVIDLYDRLHKTLPGEGYDKASADWQQKLKLHKSRQKDNP